MPRIFGWQIVTFAAGAAEKAARSVVAFIYRNLIAAPDKFVRCGQTSNTCAENRYFAGH